MVVGDFSDQAAQYLEDNEVYDLFHDLLQKLIVKRPANPIDFLKDCLQETAGTGALLDRLVVVGKSIANN